MPAGTFGIQVESTGYLPSAIKNVTVPATGTVAGPNVSLSASGVDSINPFDALFNGVNAISGSLVTNQLTQFNPTTEPITPLDEHNLAQPFLNIAENDPNVCVPEIDADIALRLRLGTLLDLSDKWASDYNDLILIEGKGINIMLRDIALLGLALLPVVGQAKQAAGAVQISVEAASFASAFASATATLLDSVSRLVSTELGPSPPTNFKTMIIGDLNTYVSSLATAAGLKNGSFASVPFIKQFFDSHPGLFKFLGPFTAIVNLAVNIVGTGQSIVAQETTVLNDKTAYQNAVTDTQVKLQALVKAIADCRDQKSNNPKNTPTPTVLQPVAWSHDDLPNVIFVTSNGDSAGGGTLRAAISQANSSTATGPVEIDFSQLTNPTIKLLSALPNVLHPIYLYGMTGPNCVMLVIDGSQYQGDPQPQFDVGEAINLVASDSIIRDVDFVNFPGNPVEISGTNDTIDQTYLGVDTTGETAAPIGGAGIVVTGLSDMVGSPIPGNGDIVSNTGLTGIVIAGNGDQVVGNLIGVDKSGTIAMSDGAQDASNDAGSGIAILTAGNTIGGTISIERNVIAASAQQGIVVGGTLSFTGSRGLFSFITFGGPGQANNNVIEGNYIGTDATGENALGNKQDGILIALSATGNTIGGSDGTDPTSGITGAGNLISGNGLRGVEITSSGATGNVVLGNYIGLDATGTKPLGNKADGIAIDTNATGNTVGGSSSGATNIISANAGNGISLVLGASANSILGNWIGTDRTGTVSFINSTTNLGNSGAGIEVLSSNNTIGGADVATAGNALSGAGNLISGNALGILISQPNSTISTANLVLGNYIGTDSSGRNSLPNQDEGILLSSDSNTIGGTSPATRNIISGNVGDGITLSQSATVAGAPAHAPLLNIIQDNFIGTDASGTNALGNTNNGITITGGSNNTIGGATTAASNLISANGGQGIQIVGTSTAPATTNVISGNIIGTDFTSSIALGNFSDGIGILNSSGNLIGGLARGSSVGNPPGNAIAGNAGNGIFIQGALSTGNTISGNVIGLGARVNGQPTPLSNSGSGIQIDSSSGNQVGGTTAGAANVIAGNTGNGIGISDTLSTGSADNVVQGNFIGVTDDLLAAGNGAAGVSLQGVNSEVIGGSIAAARNVIASNSGNGVELLNSASGNQVLGNWIGYTGTAVSGNSSDGVFVSDSGNNTIGGITAGSGNVISGNLLNGVELRADSSNPANSAGIGLIGNFIGTNDKGTATTVTTTSSSGSAVTTILGNGEDGVLVEGVPQLTIGEPLAGGPGPINLGGNLISGNLANGIQLVGEGAAQITIQANFIGTDVSGTLSLANSSDGIFIVDTPDPSQSSTSSSFGPVNVSIGGSVPGTGNLISGNAGNGIEITGRGQTDDTIQGNMIGTDLAGTTNLNNGGSGVLLEGVSANTVGGTTGTSPDAGLTGVGNLISGNLANGIALATVADSLGSAIPDSNIIQGNFVGTDITGTKPISNGTVATSNATGAGIFLDGATNTTIGGIVAAARNLISANRAGGIAVENESSSNVILGNFIGTDTTGSFTDPEGKLTDSDELSNDIQLGSGSTASDFGGGVLIVNSPNNQIGSPAGASPGGPLSGGGNLIADIMGPGIQIEGNGSQNNLVQNNFIGTNLVGTKALVAPVAGIQTGNDGIVIVLASSNQIGGSVPGTGNLISGNLESGVAILGSQSTGNVVEGNIIGSDVTGTKAIPNAQAGVLIGGAVGNLIGGPSGVAGGNAASGPANLISAGGAIGGVVLERFTLSGTTSTPTGNQIEGNLIGTDLSGTRALSSSQPAGIEIEAGVGANTIGGLTASDGNVIAFSSGSGIAFDGQPNGSTFTDAPVDVTIMSNSIFSNVSDGIDFKRNNWPVATPPNLGEVAPTITDAFFDGSGDFEVDGTLQSLPNTTFLLQFFATPVANQAQLSPQGQILLNATPISVTTDGSGLATFTATELTAVPGDMAYTATATDPAGNTSDYTTPDTTVQPQPPSDAAVDLSLTGTAKPNPVAQGGQLTYQFTVTNKGPSEATGVLFTDTLPAGVTLVSTSPSQGSVTGTTTLSWLVNSLIRGQQATLDFVVSTSASGTLTDSAMVVCSQTLLNPGDNQATLSTTVGPSANLAVTVPSPPASATLGALVTYTVKVTNEGPAPATGVTLTEASLAGQGLVIAATASQGTVNVADPLVAELGSLAVGASATVTITAAPTSPGTFSPSFSAASGQADVLPAEAIATVSIPVALYQPVSAVALSSPKTLLPAPLDPTAPLPAITPNGQFIAFSSTGSDIVPGIVDTAGYDNVYVLDVETGVTTLVSSNAAGTGTGDGNSTDPSISANGQFVEFLSDANDLATGFGDGNGSAGGSGITNVYVRNLLTSKTTLASATTTGTLSPAGIVTSAILSPSGQFVVFDSNIPNLVAGENDPTGVTQTFVYNVQTGATRLVSENAAGTGGGNAVANVDAISGNSQFVLFSSSATDLVSGVSTPGGGVFRQDLSTGQTELVSVNSAGTAGGNGTFDFGESISDDGNLVVFDSDATNLVAGTISYSSSDSEISNVFVRNMETGTTQLVSIDSTGTEANNGEAIGVSISGNGTEVAFFSDATNLVKDLDSPFISTQLYVRNLTTGTTSLASITTTGGSDPNAFPINSPSTASFSDDGRDLVFVTASNELVPGSFENAGDLMVVVRDLVAGTTTYADLGPTGTPTLGATGGEISGNGHFVVFGTSASGVVQDESNGGLFVRDLLIGHTQAIALVPDQVNVEPVPAPYDQITDGGEDPTYAQNVAVRRKATRWPT